MSRETPPVVAKARELPPGLNRKSEPRAPGANRKRNGTRGYTHHDEVGGNGKFNYGGTQYVCKINSTA